MQTLKNGKRTVTEKLSSITSAGAFAWVVSVFAGVYVASGTLIALFVALSPFSHQIPPVTKFVAIILLMPGMAPQVMVFSVLAGLPAVILGVSVYSGLRRAFESVFVRPQARVFAAGMMIPFGYFVVPMVAALTGAFVLNGTLISVSYVFSEFGEFFTADYGKLLVFVYVPAVVGVLVQRWFREVIGMVRRFAAE